MERYAKKIGCIFLIVLFIYLFVNNLELLFFLLFTIAFYYFIIKLLIAFYRFIVKKISFSTTVSTIVENKDDTEDKKEVREIWPYRKKNYFFNRSERKFYYTLGDILGDKYFLFSKVRILDLLYLPKYLRNSYHYLNKIQSKHIDFIICDKQNIKPLLAIELDGSSHLRKNRIERDKFVNEIFKDAGLPILHIKVCDSYDKFYLSGIIGKEIEL